MEINHSYNTFKCKSEDIKINDIHINEEDENQPVVLNTYETQNSCDVQLSSDKPEHFVYHLRYNSQLDVISSIDTPPISCETSTDRSDLGRSQKLSNSLSKHKYGRTNSKKSPNHLNLTEPKTQQKSVFPHKCERCKKCFKKAFYLKRHQLSLKCSKTLESKSKKDHLKTKIDDLEDDLKMHDTNKPYFCVFCGEGFKIEDQLKEHLFQHTGIPFVTCVQCKEQFQSAEDLKRHHKKEHGKFFTCPHCPKRYTQKRILKDHMINHTDSGFKCNHCSKKFSTISFLNRHMTVHSEKRPHSCEQCEKSFKTPKALQRHRLTIHIGHPGFSCPVCSKTFSDRGNMKRHQDLHSSEKKYQCVECGKSFFQKQGLLSHMAFHHPDLTDAKPRKQYKPKQVEKIHCDICFKSVSKRYFPDHMMTHTDLKPYKCLICGMSFNVRVALYNHSFLHKEKQFACKICGAAFRVKNYLKQHIRVHTGEKPYQCEVCDRRFASEANYHRHKKTHD